jgi:DNA-binding LacI/PurR family transcriptional regulator
MARSLRRKRSELIGIVLADLTNPFYAKVLDLLLSRLREAGHRAILLKADRSADVDTLISELLEYQVDGVVIASTTLSSIMAETCEAVGAPVVMLNRQLSADDARHVCCDNSGSAALAAQHFARIKRSSLCFLSGKQESVANQGRQAGFCDKALELGFASPKILNGDFSYGSGYRAAMLEFTTSACSQAVFCANDLMAMGFIDGLRRERSLRVPEDVAVIGFDDVDSAEWPTYELTTIRQPIDRMVERTLDLLIEGRNPAPTSLPIPGELVIRSTA